MVPNLAGNGGGCGGGGISGVSWRLAVWQFGGCASRWALIVLRRVLCCYLEVSGSGCSHEFD